MLNLQHVSKWYNSGSNRTFILKDLNLQVKEGAFVSIMVHQVPENPPC